MNSSLERSRKIRTAGVYAFFIIGSVIMIFPFVWMFLTSFKTVEESMIVPPTILPAAWQSGSYDKATASLPFFALYKNTILMIFWRVVCAVLFSSMAGYAFAKLNFKGKNVLFSLVLIQMMLPSQIFITPQYQMLAKVGLTNSIFGLVFPGLVSAFGTFFLRQAYLGIPNEIAEAAYLDGCNQWQTFVKVMAPLTKASMAALAVFTAVFAYGDLMWPLIVNTDLNMMTLSSGLATLRGQFSTDFPTMMAGSLLAMIPMVVLYLFFQKQFIEGVAMTGGK
ncbi:MAG: carbohydrate ABC transporter permease [Lachnospiraceae bacterium]|jgi:multiple sugar transport system permease protein|nr:carbohydrate ABC transporter permease [Lachnospiraceae bacterium]